MGLIPSRLLGKFAVIFLSHRMMAPARKPAAIPPRKPDTVAPPPWKANFATKSLKPPRLPILSDHTKAGVPSALKRAEFPLAARRPPVKPTARPGRSAMDCAIYPADLLSVPIRHFSRP